VRIADEFVKMLAESRRHTGGNPTDSPKEHEGGFVTAVDVASWHQTIRVVVVDDQPLYLEAVQRRLDEAAGIEVVAAAADDSAALEIVRASQPNVLILNLPPGDSSGLETARGAFVCCPDLAVLVIGDHLSFAQQNLLERAGVRGLLPKTISGGELVAAVTAVAAGRTIRIGSAATAALGGGCDPLTAREHEVLRLIAEGLRNREIANALIISPKTIEEHVTNLLRKLGVHSRTQAVRKAQLQGLL
jgi:DNA-binding NarL/FixJ family response regulator